MLLNFSSNIKWHMRQENFSDFSCFFFIFFFILKCLPFLFWKSSFIISGIVCTNCTNLDDSLQNSADFFVSNPFPSFTLDMTPWFFKKCFLDFLLTFLCILLLVVPSWSINFTWFTVGRFSGRIHKGVRNSIFGRILGKFSGLDAGVPRVIFAEIAGTNPLIICRKSLERRMGKNIGDVVYPMYTNESYLIWKVAAKQKMYILSEIFLYQEKKSHSKNRFGIFYFINRLFQ